jgi:hypothetical protein
MRVLLMAVPKGVPKEVLQWGSPNCVPQLGPPVGSQRGPLAGRESGFP